MKYSVFTVFNCLYVKKGWANYQILFYVLCSVPTFFGNGAVRQLVPKKKKKSLDKSKTCKGPLLSEAGGEGRDTEDKESMKKSITRILTRMKRKQYEWLKGREDERTNTGKCSRRRMKGNKRNIKIFREWSWGRAKQDHMSSTWWGKWECWASVEGREKLQMCMGEIAHYRKSPCLRESTSQERLSVKLIHSSGPLTHT